MKPVFWVKEPVSSQVTWTAIPNATQEIKQKQIITYDCSGCKDCQ